MIDEELATLALRARAASLVVATTGSTTLEATATGYVRASGSFLTDGFRPGMEVVPTGFTQTTVGIVDKTLTATVMPIIGGRTVQASGSGRTLAVGLPLTRSYENIVLASGPPQGRPWINEDYVPGGASVLTLPTRRGLYDEDGLYILTWYGVAGLGLGAIRKGCDKLKALYAPGTSFTLSDGTVIRIRGDHAPIAGQITAIDGGWAYCQVTIPWRSVTRNQVVA